MEFEAQVTVAAAGEGNNIRLNPSGFRAFSNDPLDDEEAAEVARAIARARARAPVEEPALPTTEEESDVDFREDPGMQAYAARALAAGYKVTWSAKSLVIEQQTKHGDRPRKLPPRLLYKMAHA